MDSSTQTGCIKCNTNVKHIFCFKCSSFIYFDCQCSFWDKDEYEKSNMNRSREYEYEYALWNHDYKIVVFHICKNCLHSLETI